jgi:hypothetical protein
MGAARPCARLVDVKREIWKQASRKDGASRECSRQSVGTADGPLTATAPISEVPKTATYAREYEQSPGFLTLVSDRDRLTGAYGLGPKAGEWMQQARWRSGGLAARDDDRHHPAVFDLLRDLLLRAG